LQAVAGSICVADGTSILIALFGGTQDDVSVSAVAGHVYVECNNFTGQLITRLPSRLLDTSTPTPLHQALARAVDDLRTVLQQAVSVATAVAGSATRLHDVLMRLRYGNYCQTANTHLTVCRCGVQLWRCTRACQHLPVTIVDAAPSSPAATHSDDQMSFCIYARFTRDPNQYLVSRLCVCFGQRWIIPVH
jgi:ABC-type antimicrobial peptide transport system ATPase subunit